MSRFKLFALSVLLTAGGLLAVIYVKRPDPVGRRAPTLVRVADDLYVTSQLTPQNVRYLRGRGIATLVDIRPDGEARDQPPSSEIEDAARQSGIAFFYIPVPHEAIPDDAVDALRAVLAHQVTPTVLYCRSGKRAARTFALAEASRAEGPSCDTLLDTVHRAGFSADDLRDNINQRISHRHDPTETKAPEPTGHGP